MSKSPGHQNRPDHKVEEHHLPPSSHVTVEIGGQLIADSHDVIRLDEDGHPSRFYFPRSDVTMDKLERSETTSDCPFKGTARYFTLRSEGHRLDDAVWSYEAPFDEHAGLKGRLAFYDDKYRDIHVRAQ
ncbi:MAG: DUF427 domain-containing protein [Steroidobacteraceae bacterium]